MSNSKDRGLFIVVEGVDRAGKTTQVKRLVQMLETRGWRTLPMAFPDRCTGVGMLVDDYLKRHKTMSHHCVHLLFSANRWEQAHVLESFINSGTTIVCDRYAYSGVVYSHGANGLDVDWCLQADKGLIRPDVVFQLLVDPIECSSRGSFGVELYETVDVAQRVARAYEIFHKADNWVIIPSPLSDTVTTYNEEFDTSDTTVPSRRQTNIQFVSQKIEESLDEFLETIPHKKGTTSLPLRRLGDGYPI